MATDQPQLDHSSDLPILGQWHYARTLSILSFFALFAVMAARIVISPMFPQITSAFGISESILGLAITGMAMLYGIGQLVSGILGDRYGERRIVLLALGLTVAGGLLLATAPTFAVFALFAGLLGAGSGLYRTAAESLLERVSTDTDSAISTHAAGAATAGLIAPSGAVLTMQYFGWRAAITLIGVVAVAVFVSFWWFSQPVETSTESVATDGRAMISVGDVTALASSPSVLYTTGIAVLANFSFEAFLTFLPLFLIQYWGFSAGAAGAAFGVVAFCSIVGLFVVGRIAETYISRDTVLIGLYAITSLGYAVLLFRWSELSVWVGAVLLGAGFTWSGLLTSRFMAIDTNVGKGTALGIHKTARLLLGSLGPVTVGTLSEVYGWSVAYGLVIVMLTAVTVSLIAVRIFNLDI